MHEVSVVIPTYNASDLLMETVDRVLAQTWTDFELLVVNDGSTDSTAEALARVGDPRLRVVHQANAGIGNARNRGIQETHGHLVALLDHDDIWEPTKLETQLRFMQSNPECVGCTVHWAYSTFPDRPVFQLEGGPREGVINRPIRRLAHGEVFLISSAIMARREALEGLAYFTRPKCIEDTPLQVRLLGRGPFGIAGDKIEMVYRWHQSNYSSQAAFFANGIRLLRELDRDGYFQELTSEYRADLSLFLNHLGRTAFLRQLAAGERRNAVKTYLREIRFQVRHPSARYLLGAPILAMMPGERAMQFLSSK